MKVELVRVTTSDGLRLDGALLAPAADVEQALPIDAALLVHGTGSNFYSASLFAALMQRLAERGAAVLSVNTRGHDVLSVVHSAGGAKQLGAAREVVGDCFYDLSAWIELLHQRGYQRVVLIGHSLGAIKGVYTLARDESPDVACLCAISPAHLSHHLFSTGPRADEFLGNMAKARELVAAGRGGELMDVRFPVPYTVSAEGYLDKYGPEDRYNVLGHLPRMKQPTLVTFGSLEVQDHIAFRHLPAEIEKLQPGSPHLQVATIAGGDHVYAGVRNELFSRMEGWLRKQVAE